MNYEEMAKGADVKNIGTLEEAINIIEELNNVIKSQKDRISELDAHCEAWKDLALERWAKMEKAANILMEETK